jgi:hypothetical protein
MLEKLLDWLFQCRHAHTSFPQGRHPHAHVTCLDCGREFGYDVRTWTRGGPQPTTTTNVLRKVIHPAAKEV